MGKTLLIFLCIFCLQVPQFVLADECMEGNCDDGIGTDFTDDGKIYEGEWKDGLPHGEGKLHVAKGEVLESQWEKGELVQEQVGEKTKK